MRGFTHRSRERCALALTLGGSVRSHSIYTFLKVFGCAVVSLCSPRPQSPPLFLCPCLAVGFYQVFFFFSLIPFHVISLLLISVRVLTLAHFQQCCRCYVETAAWPANDMWTRHCLMSVIIMFRQWNVRILKGAENKYLVIAFKRTKIKYELCVEQQHLDWKHEITNVYICLN